MAILYLYFKHSYLFFLLQSMKTWVQYALIAAVFLSVKNMISKHLSTKYSYLDYLIYAITLSFIVIWTYVIGSGHKPKPVKNGDIAIILLRVLIVYAIIDPSIYKAFKTCGDNPGKASCVINMEVIVTFILSAIFLKAKIESSMIVGALLMLTGGYLISYK